MANSNYLRPSVRTLLHTFGFNLARTEARLRRYVLDLRRNLDRQHYSGVYHDKTQYCLERWARHYFRLSEIWVFNRPDCHTTYYGFKPFE